MIEKGWGRIINITGMNAIHGYKGRAPVSAAKHGLWGLTKSLGKEFGAQGVTTMRYHQAQLILLVMPNNANISFP